MNKNGEINFLGNPTDFFRKLLGLLFILAGISASIVAISTKIEIPIVNVKVHNVILLSVIFTVIGRYLIYRKITTIKRFYDLMVWMSFCTGCVSFFLAFFSKGWDIVIFSGLTMVCILGIFLFDSLRK